jgi:Flp pilus assembly protein TadD
VLYFKGQYDESIGACRKGLELDPNFAPLLLDLGTIYLKKQMFREAMTPLRKVRELTPETVFGLGNLGYAHARSGDRAQAVKVLDELEGWRKKGISVNYEIAFVYLGLDDRARALDSLDKAIGESGMLVNSIGFDPLCEELRPDPRFQALLRKMNLVK